MKKLGLQQYVCKIFFKDLKTPNDDFQDIWERVKMLSPFQSQWKARVPTHWIEVERRLQQLTKMKTDIHLQIEVGPVIKYKKLLQIAPSSFPSPKLFVKYMQTSGQLLALDVDNLSLDDDLVIDIQWLIDAFKQVIDFNKCEGKLTVDTAKEIWKGDCRFRDETDILLTFMEFLGLIAKPHKGSFYYITSLLKPDDGSPAETTIKNYLASNAKDVSKTLVLDFRKNDKQIPFPHFDKLMTEFISRQSEEAIIDFKRHFCIIESFPVGFILCHGCSIIKMTVFTLKDTDEASKAIHKGEIGNDFLHTILNISEVIARKFKQRLHLDPVKGLSCNPYPSLGLASVSYIKCETLLMEPKAQMCCCRSPNTPCERVEAKDLDVWKGEYKYLNLN